MSYGFYDDRCTLQTFGIVLDFALGWLEFEAFRYGGKERGSAGPRTLIFRLRDRGTRLCT